MANFSSEGFVQMVLDWRQWNSHTQRVLTAGVILIPLLLVIGLGPTWAWLVVIALASCLGLAELERMLVTEGFERGWRLLYLGVGLALPCGAWLGGPGGLHGALVGALFCGFAAILFTRPQDASATHLLCRMALGWLYIPYLLSYVMLIGQAEAGRACIFFTLFVMIANDAGAFYTGRRFGRHKLYEVVSPKKTIEGSLGGTACCLLMGCLCGPLFMREYPAWRLLEVSFLLSVAGPMGDLFESMMKRTSGIKDSGHILPGHGGILDRLDSLLFAFPISWFLLL